MLSGSNVTVLCRSLSISPWPFLAFNFERCEGLMVQQNGKYRAEACWDTGGRWRGGQVTHRCHGLEEAQERVATTRFSGPTAQSGHVQPSLAEAGDVDVGAPEWLRNDCQGIITGRCTISYGRRTIFTNHCEDWIYQCWMWKITSAGEKKKNENIKRWKGLCSFLGGGHCILSLFFCPFECFFILVFRATGFCQTLFEHDNLTRSGGCIEHF